MNKKEKKAEKKNVNNVQQLTDKAIKKFEMIEQNDKVLVGISGGLDSLVLLELLSNKKKYYKFDFEIKALHINILNIPYQIRKDSLSDFCSNLGIELIYVEKEIEIDESKITTNPCFICSWNRRKELFNYSKQHNFNKLALGHHKDDAVETFLMNLVYHSSISSLPANLKMFEGRMHLIRPMIYLSKEDIEKYAKIRNITTEVKTCIYDKLTNRRKMLPLIEQMQKFNPYAKDNIFKAMSNIFDEYLPK